MGVSSLGYLAGKVVRKPGPIIKQLDPPPPYGPTTPLPARILIVGASLSPRAQVWINGVQIPPDNVEVPPSQSKTAEFVTELAVDPQAALPAPAAGAADAAAPPAAVPAPAAPRPGGVPSAKVVNPDGQSAEV